MTVSSFDITNLTKNIDHLINNTEELLEYVYKNCKVNKFLKECWKELCLKVSHGVVLIKTMRHLVDQLNHNKINNDELDFSLVLIRTLGFCVLLLWEIYKLIYTHWLKFLVEPSIIHKGTYPTEIKIEELKGLKVFVNPSQIDSDTHEIARRVARFRTQFDVYNSYMFISILSDIRTIVYLSYNRDKYVSVEKKKIDPSNKLNFAALGKAIELLSVWRRQIAHFGDYLLACKDIFREVHEKHPPPNFDPFKNEILKKFSLQATSFIRYVGRLFWELGEAVRIQNETYEKINEIFNYNKVQS